MIDITCLNDTELQGLSSAVQAEIANRARKAIELEQKELVDAIVAFQECGLHNQTILVDGNGNEILVNNIVEIYDAEHDCGFAFSLGQEA